MGEVKTLPPVLGVQSKPKPCEMCAYKTVGSGWLSDWIGKRAKVLFMFPSAPGDDFVNRFPLSGRGGNSFLHKYIEPLGFDRDDCAFAHVIRCRPKGDGSKKAKNGQYPTGFARKSAETSCRYYDRNGVVEQFNPDSYVLSFDLGTIYSEPAFTRLFGADVKKAFDLASRGYRPVMLLGNPAAELLARYINGNGGVKSWRGEWRPIDSWPWLSGSTELSPTSTRFIAA